MTNSERPPEEKKGGNSNDNSRVQFLENGDVDPKLKPSGRRLLSSQIPPGGRISTRDLNFNVPSNMGAQQHVVEKHGLESAKAKALRFLHQKWVQLTLMGLLLLDVVILFVELMLLSIYPSCSIIVRDCIACCQGSEDDGHANNNAERWLEGDNHEEICEAGYEETGQPSCDDHKWHTVHAVETLLFALTITILTIFLIENLVEMWALTPSVFFRQIFFALDFFIITVSLALELVFHYIHKDVLEELAGFVVFFRIWRFVRIGHGIVEVTSEMTHDQYEDMIHYAYECEEVLKTQNLNLPETTKKVHKKISELEDSLSRH